MSHYTDFQYEIKKVSDYPPKYIMGDNLHWEIGRVGSGLWITVPKDFEFDLSVPYVFSWIFNPNEPHYLKAAALHDYLLSENYDWVFAAGVFNRALKSDGVNGFKRSAMFFSVLLYKYS